MDVDGLKTRPYSFFEELFQDARLKSDGKCLHRKQFP